MPYVVKLAQTHHYEFWSECDTEEDARKEAVGKLTAIPNLTQTYYVIQKDDLIVESVEPTTKD